MSLIQPLLKRLEKFALTISGNREEAKDIVGETAMIAWERFSTLKSDKAFLSFLFTIASRVYKKRQKYFIRYRQDESIDIDALYCHTLSAETAMDTKILYEAMNHLPGEQKEALILFEILGFSQKEISEIQKTSISNVKMRVHRAKEQLRAILKIKTIDNKKIEISELSSLKGR